MTRDAVGLVLGLIIGIQLTEYWNYSYLETTILERKSPRAGSQAVGLFNCTRVLCMVLTDPLDYGKNEAKVKSTWGRRCNKLIFWRKKNENNTFATVRQGFKNIFEKHFNGHDWFLRADTDT